LYKAILKPIWIYGVQLWGTAANSNIEIIQRFQNKYLRIIVNANRRKKQSGNKQRKIKSEKDSNIYEWDHLESKGIRKNGKSNICETM